MATNDLFKTVNYNDGEGLTHGDANDAQRFLAARLYDQLWEKLVPGLASSGGTNKTDFELGGENGTNVSTLFAYALKGGQAYLAPGSANNKVKIVPGTLFQKVGVATGAEPSFLAYTFTGAEEVTIANGDPTNPRVDLIQMQLSYVVDDLQSRDFQDATSHVVTTQSMNKKRQIQCVLSVKQGTPANPPTYPTADAGTVIVGAVHVLNNETFASPISTLDGTNTKIHDHRIPLNVRVYVTTPNQMNMVTGFATAISGNWKANNATNQLLAYCPVASQGARLLGVSYRTAASVTTGTIEVGQVPSVSQFYTLNNARASVFKTTASAQWLIKFTEFQANYNTGENSYAVANAAGFGPPIWCSGNQCINKNMFTDTAPGLLALNMQNIDNGSEVGAVYWFVAE